MKIKWNGHASFTITGADGTVIVTDPYEPGGYDGAVGYGAIEDQADVALVSHGHPDHNFVQGLPGKPRVLESGGAAKGIDFTGVDAAHDESGGSERGKIVMFVFTVDGVRVGFMGDLGHLLTDAQLAELGAIDLLLAPIGGVFTLDPDGAAKLVEQVGPKLMIPMHYKNDKCHFPLAEVDDFAKRMINVKKIGESEVELDASKLPAAGPEVWVLEHAC